MVELIDANVHAALAVAAGNYVQPSSVALSENSVDEASSGTGEVTAVANRSSPRGFSPSKEQVPGIGPEVE